MYNHSLSKQFMDELFKPRPTVTVEEVELLRQEILQQDNWRDCEYRLIHDFTVALHLLLEQEGYPNTYTMPTWHRGIFGVSGGYSSGIRVTLGVDHAEITIHPIYRTLICIDSFTCPKSIQILLDRLHELRYSCVECRYSNDTTEFCGKGLEMKLGCTSFVGIRAGLKPGH